MSRINTRIIHKHDTQVNWAKATGFIPLDGEIIIYDPDDNFSYSRVKVGDGETNVNDLPFVNDVLTDDDIDAICGSTLEFDTELTDELTGSTYTLYVSGGKLKMTEVTE